MIKEQFELLSDTRSAWTEHVIANMDAFLIDHAACERKASSMAISMLTHYPDRHKLVTEMTDLALEEMSHFRQVMQMINEKQLIITPDEKDPYINALLRHMNKGRDAYFLDRLLLASIIEKRGAERFQLISEALDEGKLKDFYHAIAKSEKRHYELFLTLAYEYFSPEVIEPRLQELLVLEAKIINDLPIRAALH